MEIKLTHYRKLTHYQDFVSIAKGNTDIVSRCFFVNLFMNASCQIDYVSSDRDVGPPFYT